MRRVGSLPDSAGLPPGARVYRRGTPVDLAGAGGCVPTSTAGQRVERTFGPLRDRDGQPVWFDAVKPAASVALVRSPATTPLLAVELLPEAAPRPAVQGRRPISPPGRGSERLGAARPGP